MPWTRFVKPTRIAKNVPDRNMEKCALESSSDTSINQEMEKLPVQIGKVEY